MNSPALHFGFCAFTLCGLVEISAAASISWSPATRIQGISDIDTDGTLVEAANANVTGIEHTIEVDNETILFYNRDFGLPRTRVREASLGDRELDRIVNSVIISSSAGWSFDLDGLTKGKKYQVQFLTLAVSSQENFGPSRLGDGEEPENISDFVETGSGSILGSFIADGPTQKINVLPPIDDEFSIPSISGYILRDITAVPPTDITFTQGLVTPPAPAHALLGQFVATDSNDTNTHSFSLVDNTQFPDNRFFSIENDNELRAATALHERRVPYAINVRATDSDSLIYDETLVLEVRDVSPIQSVTLLPSGLRLTIPGYPGRTLGVEYSPDLKSETWIELGNFFGDAGLGMFIDPDPIRMARPRGYYRAFLRPISRM